MEIDLILKIPLSLYRGEDRLVWHFDKKGCYTVKSGYYVGRLVEGLEKQALGSDSGVKRGRLWCKLWSAQVPPKVRMHGWRLAQGTLPTRAALIKKKAQLPDVSCVFCLNSVEDSLHLFKNCNALRAFWKQYMLQIQPYTHPSVSIEVWFWDMIDMLSGETLGAFLMTLWVIWVERNNMVWRGKYYNAANMFEWSITLLREYKECHQHSGSKKKRAISKWSCPPRGRLKVNIDGSFEQELGSGGVGVVVRNYEGECVATFARPFQYALSAFHMEAEALRAGMLICIQQGWEDVEVESDCVNLVHALHNTDDDLSIAGRVIEDCQRYVSAFNFFHLQHIYREANSVANRLARFARCNKLDVFSLDETPVII
ncbi:PREDICTED: putative ribonuclease H protein At1g65750-like [Fragaria vesca subsp. vesca]